MPGTSRPELDDPALPAGAGYAVLRERVDNQDRSIRGLAEETSSQFRDVRADMSRMSTDLSAAIKGLDTKLDVSAKSAADHARPQYAALVMGMLTAIGVAVGIIQWQTGLHDKPVDDKLLALTSSISDLTKATTAGFGEVSKNFVTEKEFTQIVDFMNRVSDLKSTTAAKAVDRMQAQLDKVEGAEVSRNEHEFHWAGQKAEDMRLQAGMDNLMARLDQLAPAGDMLKRLTEHQHELELKVYGGGK